MFTITLTGPESTGKTTLAAQLAVQFDTVWVPEFARGYLEGLGRPYRQSDLLEIACGQIAMEEDFSVNANKILFLDTSLEVIKIWSEYRYGSCHPWILEQWRLRCHDLYLLCCPDIPWAFDPQRENPHDREVLLEIYKRELSMLGANFFELSGLGTERFHRAVKIVEQFFYKGMRDEE